MVRTAAGRGEGGGVMLPLNGGLKMGRQMGGRRQGEARRCGDLDLAVKDT
jgi:hypothetical protein